MMRLTSEQQEIYDGKKGETYAKIMETLVRYGELFGAEEMVEVTGKYGHLVTSMSRATGQRKAIFLAGLSPRQLYMPILFWEQDATEIPES